MCSNATGIADGLKWRSSSNESTQPFPVLYRGFDRYSRSIYYASQQHPVAGALISLHGVTMCCGSSVMLFFFFFQIKEGNFNCRLMSLTFLNAKDVWVLACSATEGELSQVR